LNPHSNTGEISIDDAFENRLDQTARSFGAFPFAARPALEKDCASPDRYGFPVFAIAAPKVGNGGENIILAP
jgi:hypothetical protein